MRFASLITIANFLNAEVKELIAGAREMGDKAFLAMVGFVDARSMNPALAPSLS